MSTPVVDDLIGEQTEMPFNSKEQSSDVMDDRRCVRVIRSFMTRSKDYRQDYLELAQRSRRIYQNWETESRSKIKRANMQPSYGFMVIETLLPQLHDAFFGDNVEMRFEGRNHPAMEFDNVLTDFTDQQFIEMDLEPKMVHFFKNLLLDGTAIAKVPYRFQEQLISRRKMNRDPETGESFATREILKEVVFDGPDFEVLSMYDFFPDWRIREPGQIQKMRGCVHRSFKSFADLKALEKKKREDGSTSGFYENLDDVKASLKTKGSDAWGGVYWDDQAKRQLDEMAGDVKHLKDVDSVELWEYWGLYDLKGDGELEECIITVANGDVVIRKQKNFYDYKHKPFIAVPNYIRTNEFYGLAELQAVEAEIREAKAIRNARLDQINLSVNTMWLVDRAAGVDGKNLYSRPGGLVYTNDINGIKPMPIGDPSMSSAQEMQNIESQISQITAIGTPPVVGGSKSFARSATGVNFVQQFASSRLGLKTKLIGLLGFKRLVHQMMLINRQYVTDEQWVKCSDPNSENPFSILPPEAFFRDYTFILKTKPDESDEQRFQKIQSVAQIAQVAEASQPGAIKMDVLLEAMLRPLLGEGVKKFMRSPQEMQQLQQQQMQSRIQEQAANAQIGAAAQQPNAPQSSPQSLVAPGSVIGR